MSSWAFTTPVNIQSTPRKHCILLYCHVWEESSLPPRALFGSPPPSAWCRPWSNPPICRSSRTAGGGSWWKYAFLAVKGKKIKSCLLPSSHTIVIKHTPGEPEPWLSQIWALKQKSIQTSFPFWRLVCIRRTSEGKTLQESFKDDTHSAAFACSCTSRHFSCVHKHKQLTGTKETLIATEMSSDSFETKVYQRGRNWFVREDVSRKRLKKTNFWSYFVLKTGILYFSKLYLNFLESLPSTLLS